MQNKRNESSQIKYNIHIPFLSPKSLFIFVKLTIAFHGLFYFDNKNGMDCFFSDAIVNVFNIKLIYNTFYYVYATTMQRMNDVLCILTKCVEMY